MRRLLPCSLPGLRDSLESRIGVRGKPRGPHSLGLRPAGRPTHPANFQGRRKTTLCRPLVARSGEAIAMAGYAALATTAATHDGTLNIEGRWSSARNQCVLILRELGAKPTQCSSFFTLGALRADLALKLTRYCGTPAPMSPRRRRVTAMVSDLWIGLSFSARVNPRQLHAVGSTFRKCVAETAGSFGGF